MKKLENYIILLFCFLFYLRPLLEIANIIVKEREENMLVLKKKTRQSLHTYEDIWFDRKDIKLIDKVAIP